MKVYLNYNGIDHNDLLLELPQSILSQVEEKRPFTIVGKRWKAYFLYKSYEWWTIIFEVEVGTGEPLAIFELLNKLDIYEEMCISVDRPEWIHPRDLIFPQPKQT